MSDAVTRGDSAALIRLLADGVDPATFNDGEPVALLAAETGKVELVRPFLDAGLPVDWECLGLTPLMCAVFAGSVPLVEFLIARGADVDHSYGGPEPATALTGVLESAELLPVVSVLLRAGADPSLARADGWTPLMMAAHGGNAEAIRALVAAGADVLASFMSKDGDEVSPIRIAEEWGHDDAVRVLREVGAPDSAETCAVRLTVLVSEITEWLAEHAPRTHESLLKARGAADSAQVARLETEVGVRLPAEFRAYLRLFGGSGGLDYYEYDGLSVERMLHRWSGLMDLHEKGTFDGREPHELDPANEYVRCVWWHPGWVPFAEDGGGNLYCVDLAPAEEGRCGQVIQWEIRGGPVGPRAWSVEQFLRKFHATLVSVPHTCNESGRLERPG